MLTSEFLMFMAAVGVNFTMSPFINPVNQDAFMAKILWYGNFVTNGRKYQGVGHTITA